MDLYRSVSVPSFGWDPQTIQAAQLHLLQRQNFGFSSATQPHLERPKPVAFLTGTSWPLTSDVLLLARKAWYAGLHLTLGGRLNRSPVPFKSFFAFEFLTRFYNLCGQKARFTEVESINFWPVRFLATKIV